MKDNNFNDDFLKRIASGYVDYYGEKLKKEAQMIESNSLLSEFEGFDKPEDLGKLERIDKKVNSGIKRINYKRYLTAACTVAAAILLFIIIPISNKSSNAPTPTEVESSPVASSENPDHYQHISISFQMPDEFSITQVEQDKGQTIYYLTQQFEDDVVLILEKTSRDNRALLKAIDINGATAWGGSYSNYNILTFEKEGIYYTLTCKYDINTLIFLSSNIL